MRKTEKTYLVQELIRMGVERRNAYRIIYESKGQAARLIQKILPEYLILKAKG